MEEEERLSEVMSSKFNFSHAVLDAAVLFDQLPFALCDLISP